MNRQMQAALYFNRKRRRSRPIDTSRAPTVTDDASKGYAVGMTWRDGSTGDIYELSDATVGAAVWDEVT